MINNDKNQVNLIKLEIQNEFIEDQIIIAKIDHVEQCTQYLFKVNTQHFISTIFRDDNVSKEYLLKAQSLVLKRRYGDVYCIFDVIL